MSSLAKNVLVMKGFFNAKLPEDSNGPNVTLVLYLIIDSGIFRFTFGFDGYTTSSQLFSHVNTFLFVTSSVSKSINFNEEYLSTHN
jgi:hypothetical protein